MKANEGSLEVLQVSCVLNTLYRLFGYWKDNIAIGRSEAQGSQSFRNNQNLQISKLEFINVAPLEKNVY